MIVIVVTEEDINRSYLFNALTAIISMAIIYFSAAKVFIIDIHLEPIKMLEFLDLLITTALSYS
jgi:hypothetical protein